MEFKQITKKRVAMIIVIVTIALLMEQGKT